MNEISLKEVRPNMFYYYDGRQEAIYSDFNRNFHAVINNDTNVIPINVVYDSIKKSLNNGKEILGLNLPLVKEDLNNYSELFDEIFSVFIPKFLNQIEKNNRILNPNSKQIYGGYDISIKYWNLSQSLKNVSFVSSMHRFSKNGHRYSCRYGSMTEHDGVNGKYLIMKVLKTEYLIDFAIRTIFNMGYNENTFGFLIDKTLLDKNYHNKPLRLFIEKNLVKENLDNICIVDSIDSLFLKKYNLPKFYDYTHCSLFVQEVISSFLSRTIEDVDVEEVTLNYEESSPF